MKIISLFIGRAKAETFYEQYGSALLPGWSGSGGAAEFAAHVITIISELIGGAAVVMLLWGALKIATSGGNDEGRTQGKNIIIAAIVGVVLALISYVAVQFVSSFVFSVTG